MISLSNTTSNKGDIKEKVTKKLEKSFKKFNNIYIVKAINLTNENQRKLQFDLQGVTVFGKKSLFKHFLKTKSANHSNIDHLIEVLETREMNDFFLFFTNSPKSIVEKEMGDLKCTEFIQPQQKAIASIKLEPGVDVFSSLATSNEGYLRTLGLFVTVNNGKINLEDEFVACSKNKEVTVVQAKILKLLGIKAGVFELLPVCVFDKSLNQFNII